LSGTGEILELPPYLAERSYWQHPMRLMVRLMPAKDVQAYVKHDARRLGAVGQGWQLSAASALGSVRRGHPIGG
jgi:hypothetical protein